MAQLWTIYWMTPLLSPSQWGAPIASPYYPLVTMAGSPISITPAMSNWGPYSEGKPISIVGVRVAHILSDPTASGYFVLGSGGMQGADIFCCGAGVGSYTVADNFPAGVSLPQGDNVGFPANHIDLYASCDKGQQQFIVNVRYTLP